MGELDAVKPGLEREQIITLEDKHMVVHTGRPIFGTPMMVGLVEWACHELILPLLPPGFTSVGYEISMKHKAPAFVGDAIGIHAKVVEAQGRKLLFEVRVRLGDKVIGEGSHRRTVIPAS
jgi:fluoroacetyl-CoA thioesterase